jgi:hypothetical protein
MSDFNLSMAPSRLDQVINPWTWNLFTINLGQSSDPKLERRILDAVGAYGRQIGQIGDALKVLIALLDREALPGPDKTALDKLEAQIKHVDLLKEARALEKKRPAGSTD